MDKLRNTEYEELFGTDNNDLETAKRKANAFDKIATMFYDANFGSAPKSEIDLQMFSIYMDQMIERYADTTSNVLDYNACSNLKISKQLGITPERVRTLKVKKQARYPKEFKWRNSLEKMKDSIRYDERKQKIIIPMPDPNVYNEIRYFIEENGGYIEIQRGQNCIQIRPEYYLILFYDSLDEKDKKQAMKEINKELASRNKNATFKSVETREEMINHILGITENSIGLVSNVLTTFNNPLAIAAKTALKKFVNK